MFHSSADSQRAVWRSRARVFRIQRLAVSVVLLSGLVVSACEDDQTPTAPAGSGSERVVASVTVTPEDPRLFAIDETLQLSAAAHDAEGREIPGARITWESLGERIARVDDMGRVTAVGNGSALVKAWAGDVFGSTLVGVEQVATQLTFTNEPDCGIPIESTITPALDVVLMDANGHVATIAEDPVSISIETAGGGTLFGSTTVQPVDGVATFSDLWIDQADSYTLLAGLEGGESVIGPALEIYRGPRTLCVVDPISDHTGTVDVVRMIMNFDHVTGAYEIILTADAANPLVGSFRVNVNLFNPDVGTIAMFPSFFSDAVNDFSLTASTTTLTLVGADARLLSWDVGDRVFTNSLEGTGNPTGTSLFRSSVVDLPHVGFLTAEDFIAFEETARPAIVR